MNKGKYYLLCNEKHPEVRVALALLAGFMMCRALPAQEIPLSVPPEVLAAQEERIEAIERASATAVCVYAYGEEGSAGGGSGVVISPDGYALTNFHVVRPCGNFMRCAMSDGIVYDAVLVSIDPVGDVALIKLIGREDFPAAVMADSDTVRQGDWCFAVGNPFVLATDFQPTVSYGIVSGVHRYQYPAGTLLEYADCIQTDAAINPGNSGGPLFNAQGQLIGINGRGSFEKRGRVNVGVGYAISINQIKQFMGYLRSGQILDHATLGARVETKSDGRVVVTNILDSCDAFRRGLRTGDEILSFAGRSVHSVNEFKNILGTLPRDWRVSLSYLRGGQQYDIFVRLEGVHPQAQLVELLAGPRDIQAPVPEGEPEPEDADQEEGAETPAEGDSNEGTVHVPGEPPPELEAMYEEKRGYANFYFNRLETARVWEAFQQNGDFTALTGRWRLTGSNDTGDVELLLSDDLAALELPDATAEFDSSLPYEEQLGPQNSGGMLLALYMWRRFLLLGPEEFGNVTYWGAAPVPGHDEWADVIVATHDVMETRMFFDPVSGQLWGLELWVSSDWDPCEIYFYDYRMQDGRKLPGRMEVRYGDSTFVEFTLNENEPIRDAE